MNRATHLTLSAAMTSTILALLCTTAGPAVAKPVHDDGGKAAVIIDTTWKPGRLERIGDQLIRGDLLTGAGVPAPSWIPERDRYLRPE
jgi:hypothetical protein